MRKFKFSYKPIHKGVSIVDREAYDDYRDSSKIRDTKYFKYYTDYRVVARAIWKKISDASIEYESGVYCPDAFYFVGQVITNKPFTETFTGKIKSNDHTGGDVYTPIFYNLFPKFQHRVWSIDGVYLKDYLKKFSKNIIEHVPKYYFLDPKFLKKYF